MRLCEDLRRNSRFVAKIAGLLEENCMEPYRLSNSSRNSPRLNLIPLFFSLRVAENFVYTSCHQVMNWHARQQPGTMVQHCLAAHVGGLYTQLRYLVILVVVVVAASPGIFRHTILYISCIHYLLSKI